MKDVYIEEGTIHSENLKIKPTNLTELEYKGLKKLHESKNKEIVILKSDKSKKTVIMPLELYQEVSAKHTNKDKETIIKEVCKFECEAHFHS